VLREKGGADFRRTKIESNTGMQSQESPATRRARAFNEE